MTSLIEQALAASGVGSGERSKVDFGEMLEQSEKLRSEVDSFLVSKYVDFDAWLDRTSSLYQRVKQLNSSIDSTSALVRHENVSSMDDNSTDLEKVQGILRVLDLLLQTDTKLQAVKDSINKRSFQDACSNLLGISSCLTALQSVLGLKITEALREELTLQREMVKHNMSQEWNKLVVVTKQDELSTPNSEGLLKLNVVIDMSNERLKDLVASLYVDTVMKSQTASLTARFIEGLKTASHWITSYESTEVNVTKESEERVIITVSRNGSSKANPVEPIAAFRLYGTLFEALAPLLKLSVMPDESVKFIDLLREKCSEVIVKHIIKDCLSPAVPTDQSKLEAFKAVIKLTEKLEKSLQKLGFVDGSPLTDYTQNLSVLFSNKKCKEILVRARQLMKADLHNSVRLEAGDDSTVWSRFVAAAAHDDDDVTTEDGQSKLAAKLSENTLKFPQCSVSKSCIDLLSFAHEMMMESCESKTAGCAQQILYSVRDMFELYTSIVPDYHQKNIENIPQVAALYYNNCMFISHQLITLANQYQTSLSKVVGDCSTLTFVDLVPLLRGLGTNAFMDQLEIQRDNLTECLSAADGFKQVELPARYEAASQSIRQCVHQLQHLSRVWLDVLPHSNFCKAVGHLLSHVMKEMMNSILSLEDMSADDTNKLYRIMSQLIDASAALFPGDKNTSKAHLMKHAPVYHKFTELHLALNASLHDLVDRWADGKGPLSMHFSPEQVKSLIRALFQNTDRRADAISKIH